MKKKIIAATMAAAMCVSLAACGGSTASSSAESTASSTAESTASSTADAASTGDEEVDLRMAWWGSQDRHDRTIKAIELYESLHPNVKIEYEYYSFDDYFTKLKTLVASDQVWDIFQLGGNFPMYMDKMGPLLYLSRPQSYTVSIAIKLFADSASTTDYGAMFAMSTLSLIPVFLIFLFFNRYLVQGIGTSGLKG